MKSTPVTLRDIRKAKGMTMEDVSRAGGPLVGTYCKIDAGKAKVDNISVKTIIQLCYVFEMSPNELLSAIGYDWTKRPE